MPSFQRQLLVSNPDSLTDVHQAGEGSSRSKASHDLDPNDVSSFNSASCSKDIESGALFVSVTDGSANVATRTKIMYLALYFIANLGLTLFNKTIMNKVRSSLDCQAGGTL